ncbi:unnamed protein product, partial [Dovyalis caffra]
SAPFSTIHTHAQSEARVRDISMNGQYTQMEVVSTLDSLTSYKLTGFNIFSLHSIHHNVLELLNVVTDIS